ncbi:MAG: ABC transporter permease [Planctomycetota bacterium]|jgi:ribose transport system permease protein|nr:ABC transporter permease [Planctomycetota bacterium]
MNKKRLSYLLMGEAGIGIILILLCGVFTVFGRNFATGGNMTNILTQISINTVIAVGMTFVILLGGIDLSVGSVLSLCTILAGLVITNKDMPVWLAISLAILAGLGGGMACGLFNGLVSEIWKIPAFVVTLGMLNMARGAVLLISDSRTIFNFPRSFNVLGSVTFWGVPLIFTFSVVIVFIGYVTLRFTVFGRMIYAIGNNEEAARLSGHNIRFYKVTAYVICGATVGIAAILYMLRLNIASPILGNGFELNAIAAVVIGGTSMSGGKGSPIGTLIGAAIMGVLNNGLLLIGMGDFARQVVTGFIIVLAVVLDTYRAGLSRMLE